MKDTGMTMRLDPLGRVVIPKPIRDSMDIQEGGRLDFCIEGGAIVMVPVRDHCTFCGRVGNLAHSKNGKNICRHCLDEAAKGGELP